jgi:hypothetical protein
MKVISARNLSKQYWFYEKEGGLGLRLKVKGTR